MKVSDLIYRLRKTNPSAEIILQAEDDTGNLESILGKFEVVSVYPHSGGEEPCVIKIKTYCGEDPAKLA